MGSKKHKKHHKSERKDGIIQEDSSSMPERTPVKLVLKMAHVHSPASPAQMNSHDGGVSNDGNSQDDYSQDKHKKSKKKKKKKSGDKEKKHKHHHHSKDHERKEKRKHEPDLDDIDFEPPPKVMVVEERPTLRLDPRSCTIKKKDSKSPLQMLHYYLHKVLQKKDLQQFFAWPVTDVIAPGYSSIIAQPMDFSTVKHKIDTEDYNNFMEFKADIKLMCDNAMTYNRPDTVYFKAAKKLWHFASKLLTKEQINSLKKSLLFIAEISTEELGMEPPQHTSDYSNPASVETPSQLGTDKKARQSISGSQAPTGSKDHAEEADEEDQDPSPGEILAQAQKAAQAAADKLTLEKPNSQFGFLRQDKVGSTTLAILHPSDCAKETKINLEMVAGKITQGTGNILGFKEDPKNLAKPVSYLNYGPYSSYGPCYDSMFASLTKDESDLILSTYGDETGVQYAESIQHFVAGDDYAIDMVDNLLDVLTHGEHSKAVNYLNDRKLIKEEEERLHKLLAEKTPVLDPFAEIDLSLLDPPQEKEEPDEKKEQIQCKLDQTSQLLQDLARIQHSRLSSDPPPHLSQIQGPSESEFEIAEKITKSLTEISSEVTPSSIVNIDGIRKALGITYKNEPKLTGLSPEPRYTTSPGMSTLQEFLETGPMLRVCDSPSN